MKKFQYKTFQSALTDEVLNDLGKQGWELVSHTAVMGTFLGGGQYYIFKREYL